jgi:hypothetical protein
LTSLALGYLTARHRHRHLPDRQVPSLHLHMTTPSLLEPRVPREGAILSKN